MGEDRQKENRMNLQRPEEKPCIILNFKQVEDGLIRITDLTDEPDKEASCA